MTQWWLTRALLHEALGDDDAARAALDEGWRLGNDRGHVTARRDLGPDRARLAVRNGDRALAGAIAHAVSECAAEAQSSTYRAAGLRAVGWADGDPASLVEAAAIYRSAGRPLESARSSEDAGLVLAAGGDSASAAGELARAILMYEELGATRDAARVSSSLRSAGVVRGVRGPRSRPAKGWESLTPTEREVAALAADGLTNREIGGRMFVSSRTVGTHLGHVFEKLELSSRVELAAAVARQNLD
jgi:DNA-binding CsgD family transcriptional regulator